MGSPLAIHSFPWSIWFGRGEPTFTEFWNEPFTYANGALATVGAAGNWVASDLDAGEWTIVSNTAQSSNSDAAGAANKNTTDLASVDFTAPWRFDFTVSKPDTAADSAVLIIFGDAGANALYLSISDAGGTSACSLSHTATAQVVSNEGTAPSVTTTDKAGRIQHVGGVVTFTFDGVQYLSLNTGGIQLTDKRIEIYQSPPTGATVRVWKLDSFVFSTGA